MVTVGREVAREIRLIRSARLTNASLRMTRSGRAEMGDVADHGGRDQAAANSGNIG
jgi:hypothetical protein